MVVDPIEIERGGLSFMVDTAETLHGRWPTATLFLLVGEDVVETLPKWREPDRLQSLVTLVVLRREGVPGHLTTGAQTSSRFPVQHLATRRVAVSSTEIRNRVRAGLSIRGFVTDAVAEYIVSTGLYLRDPMVEDVSERA